MAEFLALLQNNIPKVNGEDEMEWSMFNVHWVMPHTVKGLLHSWPDWCGKQGRGKTWNLTPHFLFWRIWRERKMRTFKGEELSIVRVKSVVLYDLFVWFEWATSVFRDFPNSLDDFVAFSLLNRFFFYCIL